MKKEELLALLESKFQGVRKDGLQHLCGSILLMTKDEEQQKALVDGLTAESVQQYVADWRKQTDTEIAEATATREKNLRKQFDFVDKNTPKKPEESTPEPPKPEPKKEEHKPEPPKSTPAQPQFSMEDIKKVVAEAVASATKPYQDRVNELELKAVNASRKEALLKELEHAPVAYRKMVLEGFEGRRFESNEAFDTYLSQTKENVAALNQEIANKSLKGHERPTLGKSEVDGISAATADFIKSKTEGNSPLGGKQL